MRVLLVCALGMSTSILVSNMRKFADQDDRIEMCSSANILEHFQGVDVILIGPEIKHTFNAIKNEAQRQGKIAAMMETMAFAKIDGAYMYKQAKDLYAQIQRK